MLNLFKKPQMAFGQLKGTRLLSPCEYMREFKRMWAYAIVWLALSICYGIFLHSKIVTALQVLVMIIMALVIPDIGDLFQTYAKYKAKWEEHNA